MSERDYRILSLLQTTGGIVGVLLLVQFLTGVLLAFYYVPSVDHAYTTVAYIEKVVSSGSWIRSLHHYGSQWLTFFAFVHVLQLFFTESYEFGKTRWIAAILILGLVLAAGGTGYSLPWDARAFFSTRVAEGLMGGLPFAGGMARLWLLAGSDISTLTLSRFFALHALLIPGFIIAVLFWRLVRFRVRWSDMRLVAVAAGVVFVALALWCLKYPAPLGPSVAEMPAEYLPRPGTQFLWLYQSLKYIPGGLGSIAGMVLPGVALAILVVLPWLKSRKMIGGLVLGVTVILVCLMTMASYLDDRDQRTRAQLSKQAAQEEALRNEPFKPALLNLSAAEPSQAATTAGDPPEMYTKFCAQCHGKAGEGARQGPLRFPPLLGVSEKPRRTADDIVNLLKDPKAFGIEPPMISFSGKLSEEQMREIANWVVTLKR